jgi:glucosamine-6-phosphate deaminase
MHIVNQQGDEIFKTQADVLLSRQKEMLRTEIFADNSLASKKIADKIIELIHLKTQKGEHTVLGLATGKSTEKVYHFLIEAFKNGKVSFANVITFNLDEYYPIDKNDARSFGKHMHKILFDHIDIKKENIHLIDGEIADNEIDIHCLAFEQKIKNAGGIDLQLLGIGQNGHIAFNEPLSSLHSNTRLITLDKVTISAAAKEFGGIKNVPAKAMTMGIHTILQAKEIILMAFGYSKSKIIAQTIEGEIDKNNPASYLQRHKNTSIFLDSQAASQLTRIATPWMVGEILWNKSILKQAIAKAALRHEKPILKLTEQDYIENGLEQLLKSKNDFYDINVSVFTDLKNSITGWPGGKPYADDTDRPERTLPHQKRSLIFSPHPDDDIISMGGTFIRLVEQGHEVHVAYQTSGNIAVSDAEAIRFIDFVNDFGINITYENEEVKGILKDSEKFVSDKKSFEKDTEILRKVKGLIRKGEAKATCKYVGIPLSQVHFLDLPFYETGLIEKKPLSQVDIDIVKALISEIKPHQIFAAGDLADPHGTHKVCLDAILQACKQLKNEPFMADCWVWFYSGAWDEFDIHEIDMVVPMSPNQVLQKRHGIWKHQSQKDGVVFQGNDSREFWQRAEDRNRQTAELYNKLGMTEYSAMEAFRRWYF